MSLPVDANQSNPYAQSLPERSLGGAQGNYMSTGGVDNALMGTTGYMPESLNYDPSLSYSARNQQQQATAGLDSSNAYFQNLMEHGGPSVAAQQTQQGVAQANVQGMQAASAARGVDRSAAFRQAQQNASSLAGQAAIAGGTQRMQEMQQQQQFGAQGYMQGTGAQMSSYGQMRGTDIQEQQGQEALQNQQNAQYVDLAKSNAANSQKGTGSIIGGIGSMIGGIMSDVNAKENISYLPPYYQLAQPTSEAAPAPDQKSSSPMSMMSDERTKEGVHPLDGVHAYAFDYKDDAAHRMASKAAENTYAQVYMDAKQPREGVMAQDLQKDPSTAPMVQPTQDGLQIDGKRALAFTLANQAQLNERLNRLEGSGNGR